MYSQNLFRGVLLCLNRDSCVCAQRCVCRFQHTGSEWTRACKRAQSVFRVPPRSGVGMGLWVLLQKPLAKETLGHI